MESNKEYDVLFLSAHPDDTEFGCGGTYLKLARKYKVAHIILTRGEAGTYGDPITREKEAIKAAEYAGTTLEFLNFKDNHIENNAETAKIVAAIIRKYKPKIIFAPYHTLKSTHLDGLTHPDHEALGNIALKAARFAKFKNAEITGEPHQADKIIYYMIPRTLEPNIIIDISDVKEELIKLWSCHESQLNLAKGKLPSRLLDFRRIAGEQYGLELAEFFKIQKPIKIKPEDLFRI